MHKTIYIEAEDEITGIIDRIRSEGATEIFLVVPKNAMLVQGMLNLKILKKEAAKLGKNVMLVTNDKFAKKVIERAGLETADRPEENELGQSPANMDSGIISPVRETAIQKQASEESIRELGKAAAKEKDVSQIGSSSFFDGGASKDSQSIGLDQKKESESEKLRNELYVKKFQQQGGRKIDVNNSYPLGKAPIPSERPGIHPSGGGFAARRDNMPVFNPENQAPRKLNISDADEKRQSLFGASRESENPVKISQGIDLQHGWNNQKAENFFSHNFEPQPKEKNEIKEKTSKGGIFKVLAVLAVVFLFFSSLAVYGWWNFPKADITLFPVRQPENIDLEIVASVETENPDFEKLTIPATLQEVEIEKTIPYETTEEKFVSDDGKAKGKVVISNKYSSSPQPLVATTRVLSKEGKLFRITQGVTVPGMKGDAPGEVEVPVIADKPGQEFNIDPSTFTIEGFKGSPKYEKFEVVSKSPTSGGSDESGNKKAKVVSATDIENARQKTLEQLDKDLEKLILEKVGSRGKVMPDTARKEIISNSSSLSEGDVSDDFNYTIKEKIRVLVFSDEDASQLLMKALEKKLPSGYNIEDISKVNYNKAIPDYDNNKLNMKISAVGTLSARIDIENLKKGVAGKNENGIKQFLENYSELEKAQIGISPAWLGSLPVAERKIEIQIGDDGD